jgi:hypothetical protein
MTFVPDHLRNRRGLLVNIRWQQPGRVLAQPTLSVSLPPTNKERDVRNNLEWLRLPVLALQICLLIAGCSPVVLHKPDWAVTSGTRPRAPEPAYSMDFTLRDSYQPGTLRVSLNGQDITGRYSGCPNLSGVSCSADSTPDDFLGVPNY